MNIIEMLIYDVLFFFSFWSTQDKLFEGKQFDRKGYNANVI